MVLAVFFLVDDEVHAVLGDLLHVCFIAVDKDDVCAAVLEVRGKNAACSA